ncbi:MAG TPA: glycoside hydrolase family 43 protein [Catenuloplanes sp.]
MTGHRGDAPGVVRNPILPGFHPDPSVCRLGDDFFLVTSTFEYFPGLALFHSRDLVHWRQLGHVLDRPEQLPLDGVRPSGGLYAPTIRHHAGVFYVTCTLVDGTSRSGNFVVTASAPAGPWSQPVWLDDAPGIDPSLFFDDDGTAWFVGQRQVDPGEYEGHCEIWARRFDPVGLRLFGPDHVLWHGAVAGAIWAEGPRLYRIDGRYYLLIAEGGTGHDHAVTVARADVVTGPYVGNPANPVLTHRHLRRDHPIVGPGHADLVRAPDGSWWMALLAMRPYGGYFYNLGRETFLVPVSWSDGWPLVSPDTGRVELEYPAPGLPAVRWPAEAACDNFAGAVLGPQWMMLRTPRERFWSLTERPGHLRLRLRPQTLTEPVNPSFVGRRQQHRDFAAHTALDFAPRTDRECAGLVLLQNTDFQLRLEVAGGPTPAAPDRAGPVAPAGPDRAGRLIRLVRRTHGRDEVLAEEPVAAGGPLYLGVQAHGQEYTLRYATEADRWVVLGPPVDGRFLSTPVAGGFVGTVLGMYASSQGGPGGNVADFDWFEYRALG